MDIDAALVTDLNTTTTSYIAGEEPWNKNLRGFNVDTQETDDSSYVCDWTTWHGFYRTIPEYSSSIDTFSSWVIGRKLIMSPGTKKILSKIRGIGIDTIRKILLNQKRTAKLCGDSFAEIIQDKAKRLLNLKPLNPGYIKITGNNLGIITHYDQLNNKREVVGDGWNPDEIFHIANRRIANEIHGIPEVEMLQKIIKWRHQVMNTYSVIMHRYMKPTYFYETETDDDAEIAQITAKIDKAVTKFENVVLPKGTLAEIKQVKTAQMSSLDPMPWLNYLKRYFVLTTGVPDIVQGESRESAISSGELNYISYKERVKQEQQDYSDDIKAQLGLDITFEEPREITIEQNPGDVEGSKTNKKINKEKPNSNGTETSN